MQKHVHTTHHVTASEMPHHKKFNNILRMEYQLTIANLPARRLIAPSLRADTTQDSASLQD